MSSPVGSRPFVVATVLFGDAESGAVRELLEAIAPDQGLSFLLLEDDALTGDELAAYRLHVRGATRLRDAVFTPTNAFIDANAAYFLAHRDAYEIRDNTLRVAPDDAPKANNLGPFLSSVADDQGRRSCVIIFASANEHERSAATGITKLAEAGGLVLVQDIVDGPFRRVMRSSEQTEPVVTRVQVKELAGVVLEHAEPLVAESRPRTTSALYSDVEEILPELCDALREATGHDFGQYKSSTLVRRTLRRLHLIRCDSAQEYLQRIRTDRAEAQRLFNDLLISVTAFFRDTDAFQSLAMSVIPKIFAAHPNNEPVRVWVAGCATGEEAYSLAMLLREYADLLKAPHPIQIFASDLDDRALSVGRRGRYPAARLAHVSPERIERFFTRSGTSFQVSKEIRDLVLFTRHNVINDPPFSNLDLVSCRNLLIYLGDQLHHRIIPLFHYALRPDGFLFLGPAESLSAQQDLFKPIDLKHRISQRAGVTRRLPPMNIRGGQLNIAALPTSATGETETLRIMQQMLVDEFTPKGVVVNDEGQVLATSANLAEYLMVPAGSFVNSVTRLVRDGLRMAVRSVLRESVALGKRVVHNGGTIDVEGGIQRVTVFAQPLASSEHTAGLYLIVFQPIGHALAPVGSNAALHASGSTDTQDSGSANALIERLELDLASMREELHRTVQDLEAVNEELKSSNEELLSMNEELQSSNEELESSKNELQDSNDLLESTNSDLTNLLVSTQIPTLFLDNQGNVRRVTPTASAIYNLFPHDVGRPLDHFTHKAEFMPPLPAADLVHRTKRAIETDVKMRDGTTYVRRVLPYLTTDGVLDGIVVTFTDVTDERKSAGALIENERRFRQLAESLPQLAWMAHPNGDIFWYNQRWYDYTGTTAEEMLGWGWTSVHDPDALPVTLERWRNAIVAGASVDMVCPLRGSDGQYRSFRTLVNPFRDEHGDIVLWFGTNTDLSEERARIEVIQRHQRELQTLADHSPDILTRFDTNFRHVFVSAAIERATGLKPSAFLGRTHREMGIPEEQAVEWVSRIKQVFISGQPQRVEFDFETPDGRRYYEGLLVPEPGAAGQVEFVLCFTRDCTRERLAEFELRDVSRRKDEFLATLAHELRNPLAPVRNGLEILRLSSSADKAAELVRDMMERQIVNMSRLIDDLLDISRISLGKVELKRARVSVQSIVESAIEIIRPAIIAAEQELAVRIPDEELFVDADGTRLVQVMGNLLHNASKYTPDHGHISLVTVRDGRHVVLQVTDDGIGIPHGMLNRIFEKFVQIEHTNPRQQDGLGIGLSLARQLVEMHGGTIRADSDGISKGSTFTVTLPIATGEQAPPSDDVDDGPPDVPGAPLRILVVDDNVEAARSLEGVLNKMGHSAKSAFSGVDALGMLADSTFDVVFLDIGLPDVTGYELASTIRRDAGSERVVLVALTGWGSEDHRRRSVEAGFDFHLTKPADLATVRRILNRTVLR